MNIAKLSYMRNAIEHGRCSLEFCCHDLKHAQHFCASADEYRQQVGFFHCFQRLLNQHCDDVLVLEKLHFCKSLLECHDHQLCSDMEYVAADMNSNGGHLFNYLKAKCYKAYDKHKKRYMDLNYEDDSTARLDEWWDQEVMEVFGMNGSDAEDAARALCKRPLLDEEWNVLKAFFRHQGSYMYV